MKQNDLHPPPKKGGGGVWNSYKPNQKRGSAPKNGHRWMPSGRYRGGPGTGWGLGPIALADLEHRAGPSPLPLGGRLCSGCACGISNLHTSVIQQMHMRAHACAHEHPDHGTPQSPTLRGKSGGKAVVWCIAVGFGGGGGCVQKLPRGFFILRHRLSGHAWKGVFVGHEHDS